MTDPSAKMRDPTREESAILGEALAAALPVPTDTFITDDIPLLLTKLSRFPSVRLDQHGLSPGSG